MIDDDSFREFKRQGTIEAAPWSPEVDMDSVSIADADRLAGSPKEGDMICRNPDNYEDQWLVAADYFRKHYRQVGV
jgi:hypothetical protein